MCCVGHSIFSCRQCCLSVCLYLYLYVRHHDGCVVHLSYFHSLLLIHRFANKTACISVGLAGCVTDRFGCTLAHTRSCILGIWITFIIDSHLSVPLNAVALWQNFSSLSQRFMHTKTTIALNELYFCTWCQKSNSILYVGTFCTHFFFRFAWFSLRRIIRWKKREIIIFKYTGVWYTVSDSSDANAWVMCWSHYFAHCFFPWYNTELWPFTHFNWFIRFLSPRTMFRVGHNFLNEIYLEPIFQINL